MKKKYRFWVFLIVSIVSVFLTIAPFKPARGAYLELPRFVSIGQLISSPNNPININNKLWSGLLKNTNIYGK